jgi:lipid-binding SYLF domain-containing protein
MACWLSGHAAGDLQEMRVYGSLIITDIARFAGFSGDEPMKRAIFSCVMILAMLFAAGCSTTGQGSGDPSARRAALNANADAALSNLFSQVNGSQELVNRARGVLVFPSVLEAGFVFGASTGDGVLRKNGRTASFHRTTSGSWGMQIGAQSTAVFLLFMTEDALARFEASEGWSVGADASVTLVAVGANAKITTDTAQQPVIGFVLSNRGLMAGITLNGTRVTRLPL